MIAIRKERRHGNTSAPLASFVCAPRTLLIFRPQHHDGESNRRPRITIWETTASRSVVSLSPRYLEGGSINYLGRGISKSHARPVERICWWVRSFAVWAQRFDYCRGWVWEFNLLETNASLDHPTGWTGPAWFRGTQQRETFISRPIARVARMQTTAQRTTANLARFVPSESWQLPSFLRRQMICGSFATHGAGRAIRFMPMRATGSHLTIASGRTHS